MGSRPGAATAGCPGRLTRRQRHPNDYVCRSRGNGKGEELTHRASCGTERAHQRLSQRQRSVSGIDRGITPTARQRAGAKHAQARCLPPLLDGGLRASASLKLAVVDSAKQAHQRQSRRGSFTKTTGPASFCSICLAHRRTALELMISSGMTGGCQHPFPCCDVAGDGGLHGEARGHDKAGKGIGSMS